MGDGYGWMAAASITSGCNGSGGRRDCSVPCRAGASDHVLQVVNVSCCGPSTPHPVWEIDFQFEQTMDGRKF